VKVYQYTVSKDRQVSNIELNSCCRRATTTTCPRRSPPSVGAEA